MSRLHFDLLQAVLDADISAAATTITFTAPLKEWGEDLIPTVASPDIVAVRVGYELMHITAYTSGASSATVLRGQEGSTATTHNEGDAVRAVPTAADFLAISPVDSVNGQTGTVVLDGGDIGITDTGGYYTGTNVEAALQEIGAGTAGGVASDVIFDAKGDLPVGTGANASARLAVGSNGQVLTADSAETTGTKWAAPASGTPVAIGCSLTASSAQSISNNTETAMVFDGETFDTDAFHDNATNNTRITVPTGKAGKYTILAQVQFATNATGYRRIRIKLNGTTFLRATGFQPSPGGSFNSWVQVSQIYSLAVGDYIEAIVDQTSGGSLNAEFGAALFQAVLIGT